MAKPKLLNVKANLEATVNLLDFLLTEHNAARSGGTVLAPLFIESIGRQKFFLNAILKNHAKKNTRKDIYVEVQS